MTHAAQTPQGLGGFDIISRAPVWMTQSERIVLYSTVIGRRPQRVLEIGTFQGGSAMIMCSAMDQVGFGRLVCVDPNPRIKPEHWREIEHRATLLSGPSPAILSKAVDAAGGLFDLALIDGDHEYPGVKADIDAVIPLLAPEAHVLFHDAHYWQVRDAIDHALVRYPALVDCGYASAEQTQEDRVEQGHPVVWGGLRALQYVAGRSSSVTVPAMPAAAAAPSAPTSAPPPAPVHAAAPAPRASKSPASSALDEKARSYEGAFNQAIAEGGSIYGGTDPMPPLTNAAHERRMALLDALPIGDLSQSVVVDFGVGSWGFACIYPRLQHCAQAIGIDISQAAIAESERISASGTFPYGNRYRYLTSQGNELPLESQSVDLLFAGEAIEHVDHPEAFIDEVYRVVKPGGQFILTTPNADAVLYRGTAEACAIGPEHVSLLSTAELRAQLEPAFEIVRAHGYNFSLHHSFDDAVRQPEVAKAAAALFENEPDLAAGQILLMRRRDGYAPRGYKHEYVHHASPSVRYHGRGRWERLTLHRELTGQMGSAGQDSSLEFPVEGDGVILQFWAHDWSGEAVIEIDGSEVARVGLYSPRGGFRTVHLRQLAGGSHKLAIRAGRRIDSRSKSDQVIFHQAIVYRRSA